jgi:hypothetical protein
MREYVHKIASIGLSGVELNIGSALPNFMPRMFMTCRGGRRSDRYGRPGNAQARAHHEGRSYPRFRYSAEWLG